MTIKEFKEILSNYNLPDDTIIQVEETFVNDLERVCVVHNTEGVKCVIFSSLE
jgi:hypothetical protein